MGIVSDDQIFAAEMSKCTNYEEVSKTYDSFRHASGVEQMSFILACMLKRNLLVTS